MIKPGEVLVLTAEDVEKLFDLHAIVEAVERAFRDKGLGLVQMPPKQYLFFGKGDLRIMPAYIPSMKLAGVKVVGVNPFNPSKGLATVIAVIELIDPETSHPLAIMDGTLITAWRTGAAGAIAAKYLARRDSTVMGVLGAGVQGRMQALFTIEVLGTITKVKVFDIRESAAKQFKQFIERMLGIDVVIVDDVQAVVKDVDILATCTPAKQPLVKSEWVDEGLHINAIGADAPGKQELDPLILKRGKVVVDDYVQASHSGEINVPLEKGYITHRDIYGELGEVIAGLKPGRTHYGEITIFDSTGLAIQDVAAAKVVYEKALKEGVGRYEKLVLA